MMHRMTLVVLLGTASAGHAADLDNLPANTWVEIKYTTQQPADPASKGQYASAGWNKIVYDTDAKRVLFYDRWAGKKQGGYTIYGNCLFAFDPAAGKLIPVRIDNWTKVDTKDGGYRTRALPENDGEPTPCPRHVYHAFALVPELKAVFVCNGANQTALNKDGKLVGHDLCADTWRLDLRANRWAPVRSDQSPPNMLDDAMTYCPDTNALIYAGHNRQIWILDLAKGQWRKAKSSPPARAAFGQTVFYDPTKKRILILGGGPLDGWTKGRAREFRELYAFDPKEESVEKLAEAPTAFYEAHLAYDSKRELFVAATAFDKGQQPSGVWCYDPKKDAWQEIRSANPLPSFRYWFAWIQLCYDPDHDCLIGKVRERFYAFRHAPPR
jgi:hypothetical protein